MSKVVYQHLVEKAVAEISLALVKKFRLSEKEAMREVYHSRFYKKLLNPKTALVTESRASQVYLYMQQRAA
ncbi:MAG: hypothetical protein J6T51_06005 [Kiritimatiellae bacterium]|nr:hypothetical protein [Kiritimatiellia bacterium]